MHILVLNAGSSSEKLSLFSSDSFALNEPRPPIWESQLKLSGDSSQEARTKQLNGELSALWSGKDALLKDSSEITAVGHRVVHGGIEFERSVKIDDSVKKAIERNAKFAPLQNPFNLLGINAIEHLLPEAVQVAVFDTAFHANLPDVARLYALPYDWYTKYGVQRFGFHGTSYFYVSRQAAKVIGRPLEELKMVICHLGNGCSLAAVSGGKSVDTTMGLTTLEGLVMGTRSGTIDPGIIPYMLQTGGLKLDEIVDALYHKSGLLALSGLSNDMREIEKAMDNENELRAKLAFDCFIQSLVKNIAAMVASMGAADAIVFTGGIGENSAKVRAAAGKRLSFLNLHIDSKANEGNCTDSIISDKQSAVAVLVIKTREDWAIAHDSWQLVTAGTSTSIPN